MMGESHSAHNRIYLHIFTIVMGGMFQLMGVLAMECHGYI